MTSYKSTTKGKAVMKPQDFKCQNCGNTEEFFENEEPWCACCELDDGTPPTMEPIFTPKNNSQRARVNDREQNGHKKNR